MTVPTTIAPNRDLLRDVVSIANAAGHRLLQLFDPTSRPSDRVEMFAAAQRNEQASSLGLRDSLQRIRPHSGWVDTALESSELQDGEWWTVDAVEGNVNHVHGMHEWGISITLIRDRVPILTVVRQPMADLTFTALHGGGAHLNGTALSASTKTSLDAALAATGQAEFGQESTYSRIGRSVSKMLRETLLVRATVPSTFPMLLVARGQNDVFWQYEPVLPGVAAGVLLVTEAGGRVSQTDGTPWVPGSTSILVAAPGVHAAAVGILSTIK
jgi:myo-inositol-1(or 4)-monophosphatase